MITNIFPIQIVEKIVPESVYVATRDRLCVVLDKIEYTDESYKTGSMLTSDEGVKNTNNFISRYNLLELENEVIATARQYLASMNVTEPVDLKIFMSWLTKINPRSTSSKHAHHATTLVCVYYCDSTLSQGKLRLFNPLPIEFQTQRHIDIDIEPGKLVLFPGWLYHEVQENLSESPRHSIAINIQIYENDK